MMLGGGCGDPSVDAQVWLGADALAAMLPASPPGLRCWLQKNLLATQGEVKGGGS